MSSGWTPAVEAAFAAQQQAWHDEVAARLPPGHSELDLVIALLTEEYEQIGPEKFFERHRETIERLMK